MNTIKSIRERLNVTQKALADGMGCTQGNVGHYERGQTVPPEAASRLIAFAATRGFEIGFDHVYGRIELPDFQAEPAAAGITAEAAGQGGVVQAG